MKRFISFVVFLLAIVSFAGSVLAKDDPDNLSGFYSVQTEEWKQQVCKYGTCEDFYTGEHITVVKPMQLADGQVQKLRAEGKLVESAPSKPAKPEKIRRAKKAKAKVVKSAPKKRPHIAKKPAQVPAISIPSESECVTHKVEKGDTVIGLAKKLGTTPEMIWALNHDLIKNPNLIKIGWNLKVPASKLAPTDSAPVSTSSGAATAPASAPVTVFMGIVIQC